MKTGHEQPVCRVRPMQREDIAGVVALAAEEATAPHWPVAEYYRMLDVISQAPGRRGAWVLACSAGEVPRAPSLPAARLLLRPPSAGRPGSAGTTLLPLLGFAMASHVAGVCDLEAVVVHADWRGRRLGAALVEAAAGWGATLYATRLQLEVRASNVAALRLYQRLGFSIDGRRPGYYRNPEEEAVLMSLLLQLSGDGEIA